MLYMYVYVYLIQKYLCYFLQCRRPVRLLRCLALNVGFGGAAAWNICCQSDVTAQAARSVAVSQWSSPSPPSPCLSCSGASIQGLLREARSISRSDLQCNVGYRTSEHNMPLRGSRSTVSVQCVTVTDSSTWDIWSSGVVISSFPQPRLHYSTTDQSVLHSETYDYDRCRAHNTCPSA